MELRLLGAIDVVDGAAPLPRGRLRTILALLGLHPNDVVSSDTLIAVAWHGAPPAGVENLLQVYISRLRHALGGERLRRAGAGYALQVEEGELDVLRFERLCERGRHALAADDLAKGRHLLGEALALWRGQEVAGGELARSDDPAVGRLQELRVAVLEERIQADLDLGATGEVVGELEALVQAHPFRERARSQLMLALYRAGRQVEALEQFRLARRVLVEELGVEPGPGLRQLQRAILEHDPSLERDLRPDAPVPIAPATSFLGRDVDLARVTDLLRRDDVRLLTLTGIGGIGKTRLALAAADALAEEFADGVHVVGLAAIAHPALVVPTIARALGIAAPPAGGVDTALEARLRDAELLLVLDNFEHVLESAPQMQWLLSRAPRLKLLVTSTAVLRLSGEREFVVPLLELPDPRAGSDVAALASVPSVALFAERAAAVDDGFVLDARNGPLVAEICRRLEGLPLAIELAASRSRLFPPEALLRLLGRRLELLAGGVRDAPVRQQTLRGTLEWSYSLLDERERRVFESLGVFVGGWTLEAADAVCGARSGLVDALASLREKSFVHAVGPELRFSMLDVLREFALERLAEHGDAAEVGKRHAAYFTALAEEVEPGLTEAGQNGLYAVLDREHGNFRAALGTVLDTGAEGSALRLAAALGRFWYLRGYFAEGREWLREARTRDPGGQPRLRAKALLREAVLALRQGDRDAGDLIDESLRLYRALGDDDGIALALNLRGHLLDDRGLPEEARACFREAAEAYSRLGSDRGLGISLANIGASHLIEGDAASAIAFCREGGALSRKVGDDANVSVALLNGGFALLQVARGDEGLPLVVEAIAIARSLQFMEQLVVGLERLAAFAVSQDDARPAARLLGAAEALGRTIGVSHAPFEHGVRTRLVAAVRERLGEQAFAAASQSGQTLDKDAAVAFALSWADAAGGLGLGHGVAAAPTPG